MASKAPNPDKYWDGLFAILPTKSGGQLLRELEEFRFAHWEASSIAYRTGLGKRLAAALDNPYSYATGTFVDGLRKAMFRHRRAARVEPFVLEMRARTAPDDKPCTKRRKGVHIFEKMQTKTGLTGAVEMYHCRYCNSFQYKVVPLCE